MDGRPEAVTLEKETPRRLAGRSRNFTLYRFDIEGPALIEARRFDDPRGYFMETYSAQDFRALGVDDVFVQDNQSLSGPAGTLRGLHFQVPPRAQAKLVRVLRGAILDIVVDIRRSSPTFGRFVAVEMTAASALQFYVPIGFAHGFCTLEPDTEVTYKVSDTYAPDCDRGLAWDDPALALPWPVTPQAALLSDKDRRHPVLAALPPCFE